MADQSQLTTRARSIGKSGELAWGTSGHPWEDETDSSSDVTFENSVVQPASAIPDSAIYQWSAHKGIEEAGGEEPVDWTDNITGVTAHSVGDPIYRTDYNGRAAVVYDGSDDGHDWSPDTQFPTGNESFSVFATVYINANQSVIYNVGNSSSSGGDAVALTVRQDHLEFVSEGNNLVGSAFPFSQWVTIGCAYDGTDRYLYLNGSLDASEAISMSIDNVSHSLGYRRGRELHYTDGGIAEVVVCNTAEPEQAFSDYHTARVA